MCVLWGGGERGDRGVGAEDKERPPQQQSINV